VQRVLETGVALPGLQDWEFLEGQIVMWATAEPWRSGVDWRLGSPSAARFVKLESYLGLPWGLISLNALSIDASTLEAALKDAFGGWCTRF